MLGIELITAPLVLMVSEKGRGAVVQIAQIPLLSGAGRGVKLMRPGDSKLTGIKSVNLKSKVTLEFETGGMKEFAVKKIPIYNRGSQGIILSKRRKVIYIKKDQF